MNLGGLLFGVALFGVGNLGAQPPGEIKITAVRNQVTQSAGGTNAPADVGHVVNPGEAVETGPQGLAELKSSESTSLRIGENSRVAFDPTNRTVKLDQGTVVVDTPSDGEPLKIKCGGVVFTLTSEESDQAKMKPVKNETSEKKDLLSQTNLSAPKAKASTK